MLLDTDIISVLVLFKVLGFILLIALGVVVLPFALLAIPLVPLILVALAVGLMMRLFGRRPAYATPR